MTERPLPEDTSLSTSGSAGESRQIRRWLVAAAIPLVLCAARLNDDLWYDEVFTLVHFAARPWYEIVTDYSAPNNHILYSLILHSIVIFSQEEFWLRVPGMFFAAGSLYWTFHAGLIWAGLGAAVCATLWLGFTQMFLTHVMEVRGYGLSLCLTAWLGALALQEEAPTFRGRWAARMSVLFASAALVYTIPTNLLVIAPIAALVVIKEAKSGLAVITTGRGIWWCGGLCLGCLLYLPVIHQLRHAAASGAGWDIWANVQISWQFFRGALRDLFPALAIAVLLHAIFPLAARGLWTVRNSSQGNQIPDLSQTKHRQLWIWWLCGVGGPCILAAVLGIRPFARNFVPVLFFLAVGCGVLFASAVDKLYLLVRPFLQIERTKRRWGQAACPPARKTKKSRDTRPFSPTTPRSGTELSLFIAPIVLGLIALPQLWTYPQRLQEVRREGRVQDGYYNFYAARYAPKKAVRAIADFVGTSGATCNYRVLFPLIDFYPLAYYLTKAGLPMAISHPQARKELVFVIVPEHDSPQALLGMRGLKTTEFVSLRFWGDYGYYQLYLGVRPI